MKMTKLTSPLPKCEHTQDLQTGHRWKYLSPTIPLRPPLLPLTFVMLYLVLKLPFLHAYIFVSIHSDVGVLHTWHSIWNRGGSLSESLSVHAEYWADFLLQPFQQFDELPEARHKHLNGLPHHRHLENRFPVWKCNQCWNDEFGSGEDEWWCDDDMNI